MIKQDEINGIIGYNYEMSSKEFIKQFSLPDKIFLPIFLISILLFLIWFFNKSILLFLFYMLSKSIMFIVIEKYIFGKLMLNDMIKSYNLYHEARNDYIKYDDFELSKKYDLKSPNGTNKKLLEKWFSNRKLTIKILLPIMFLFEITFLLSSYSRLLF